MENKSIDILIIDDIQDNLTTLQALIKEAFPEASIFQALNGQLGLEIAKKEDPDVILLDIVMPGMDGFEVCNKLKADKELREIPVVFITALKGDKESRIRALECGAEAFLAKPVDIYELTAQIQSMVKIKNANRQKRYENLRLAKLVEEKTKELTIENKAREVSEKALLEAQRLARIGSFEHDVILDEMKWTQEALNIFGVNDAKKIGSLDSLYQFIHPDDRQRILKSNKQAIAEKRDDVCQYKVVREDGQERSVELQLTPVFDQTGKLSRCVGTIQDITDRERAKEALERSEEKYRTIAESVSDVVWTTDLNLKTTYISASVEKVFKLTPDEYIEQSLDVRFTQNSIEKINSLLSVEFEKEKDSNSKKDRTVQIELEHFLPDGSTIWLAMNISFIRDKNGNAIGFLGVSRDITDRKQAEALLKESEFAERLLLEHLQVAIVVHNTDSSISFCNPLAEQILGFSANQIQNKLVTDKGWHFCDLFGEPILVDAYPFSLVYNNDAALVDYEMGIVFEGSSDIRWGMVNGFNIKDKEGNIQKVLISFVDTTEKKAAEKALIESEERYKYLLKTRVSESGIIQQMALSYHITR